MFCVLFCLYRFMAQFFFWKKFWSKFSFYFFFGIFFDRNLIFRFRFCFIFGWSVVRLVGWLVGRSVDFGMMNSWMAKWYGKKKKKKWSILISIYMKKIENQWKNFKYSIFEHSVCACAIFKWSIYRFFPSPISFIEKR